MPEQRKSSRRAILASRMHCELKLGSLLLPAVLLNESHDGFGVLVGGPPNIFTSRRAQFHYDCDWFDCRIVHTVEVASKQAICHPSVLGETFEDLDENEVSTKYITAADIEEFMAGKEGPWFRLGMRRLGRIAPPPEPAASRPVAHVGINPSQWIKSVLTSVLHR
jgi:hypothetical protein